MNNGNPANVTTDDSSSFKYKSSFFKPLTAADNGVFKDVKIAVPLKYLSNFWRSLEMPLINCKIHLELNWTKDCVMSTIADTTFKITNTKLYVPIVTLSSKDNVKLVKLLEEGFKRPVYWNEYQTKIESRNLDNNNLTRFPLDASFQGVRRLFVLAFDNTEGGAKKVKKNSHTKYFKDHYNLIAIDLSKQKELDADSRAIQQIEFYGMLKTNSQVCTVLEKSKETMLEFYKGTAKVL